MLRLSYEAMNCPLREPSFREKLPDPEQHGAAREIRMVGRRERTHAEVEFLNARGQQRRGRERKEAGIASGPHGPADQGEIIVSALLDQGAEPIPEGAPPGSAIRLALRSLSTATAIDVVGPSVDGS